MPEVKFAAPAAAYFQATKRSYYWYLDLLGQTDWMTDSLTHSFAHWLIDWLIDGLMDYILKRKQATAATFYYYQYQSL